MRGDVAGQVVPSWFPWSSFLLQVLVWSQIPGNMSSKREHEQQVGLSSCWWGTPLLQRPIRHNCPALPTPLSHHMTWLLWLGLHDTGNSFCYSCVLQISQTRRTETAWAIASKTARWSCCHTVGLCGLLPLTSLDLKFLCPPQPAEHLLLLYFFIPFVSWHEN